MEKIRIGIIGMGRMGITHFPIINSHPQVEVVSVSDTSKLILDYLAKYVDGLKVYTDYEKQLDSDYLDGIVICTPPTLHYKICKKALQNNISVFCEKPFTTSVEEAKELAEDFERAGLVNQVGYVYRCWDSFTKAKEFLDDELVGNVLNFRIELLSSSIDKPQKGNGWRTKRENGGGATYEVGSHIIDLTNYIFGKPDRISGSSLINLNSQVVDDIVHSTFHYKNGLVGQMYVNWCDLTYRKPMIKLAVFGNKGKLMVDSYALKFFLNEDRKGYEKGWHHLNSTDLSKPVPFYVRGNAFTIQLYRFVDRILDRNVSCPCSFSDGYEAQEVIHEIFNDSKTVAGDGSNS